MRNGLFVKVLVGFLTLFGFSHNAFSQEEVINQGNMIINAGIGAGNWITDNKGYSINLFPIVGSFEYGLVDLFDSRGAIGIGGYASYTSFGSKSENAANWSVSDLVVGARGLFHYQFVEKLDTYVGFMLGYDVKSYSHPDPLLPGSIFYPSLFVGARYYITNNLGVFGELGHNTAPLEVGVCYIF